RATDMPGRRVGEVERTRDDIITGRQGEHAAAFAELDQGAVDRRCVVGPPITDGAESADIVHPRGVVVARGKGGAHRGKGQSSEKRAALHGSSGSAGRLGW